MDARLFDAAFLASLQGLRRALRRARAADRPGERAARGRGGRIEFAGHRPYVPGDEVRSIDWAATARVGRPFVKEFEREASERVTVALDASASMAAFGKWDAARRIVAAAAAAALASDARLDLFALAAGEARRLASLRGARAFAAVLEALSAARAGGRTDLARSLAALPRPAGGGASLVLVSDLLDPGDPGPPLAARAARGEDLAVLEVLAPEERSPAARGTLVLRDPEEPGGSPMAVEVGDREAAAFAAEVRRRVEEHAALARRLRGVHLLARTEVPAAETVRALLRAAGAGR